MEMYVKQLAKGNPRALPVLNKMNDLILVGPPYPITPSSHHSPEEHTPPLKVAWEHHELSHKASRPMGKAYPRSLTQCPGKRNLYLSAFCRRYAGR